MLRDEDVPGEGETAHELSAHVPEDEGYRVGGEVSRVDGYGRMEVTMAMSTLRGRSFYKIKAPK